MNLTKTVKSIILLLAVSVLVCGCKTSGDGGNEKTDSSDGGKSPAAEAADPAAKEPVIVIEDDTVKHEDDTDKQEDYTVKREEADPGNLSDGSLAEPVYDESLYFTVEEISDELFEKMKGNSFPDECTTARSDLRYLKLLYKDLDGKAHEGEMVCNAAIADKLTDIFRKLYEADYPIEKIRLIDEYGGDDDASMADNNTSCFNYRVVSGTTKISKHGYGLAVDLNPFYNPYVHTVDGETVIEPEGSEPYADRDADYDYKIDRDDLAYKLFTEAGFTWGGSWKTMKDYQHFQMD